jgi:hypothetical protein
MGDTVRTCALVRNECVSSEENLKRRDNLTVLGVDQGAV